MRKFLAVLSLSLFSFCAVAEELPLVAGLKALKTPMAEIVRETAKGRQADFNVLDKAIVEADKAWKAAMAEAPEIGRHGLSEERMEEALRHLRLIDMMVGYMTEANQRGNHSLVLRTAERLPEPYRKLSAMLGAD